MKLTVAGNLEGLAVRLGRIKTIIDHRKLEGYTLFHNAENWRYSSAGDSRVCPVCSQYDGSIFSGDTVKSMFPNVQYLGSYEAYPRTHDNPGFPSHIYRRVGAPYGCGCKLTLINAAEAFEAQLHREKLGVI